MDLVKESVDIALFTNHLEEMRNFYGGRIGLAYVEMMPIGKKVQQHRYALGNAILKVNWSSDALAPRSPGGYKALLIADPKAAAPQMLADPDGNAVGLVPPGHNGINHTELQLGVSDLAAFERFYGEILGATRLGAGRFRLGQTIFSFTADSAARPFVPPPPKPGETPNLLRATAAMVALGWRYYTVQVRDCAGEHQRLVAAGATAVSPPIPGPTGAVCFFRDPDGNWIEVVQRS
jgi:catechol 2,3-dioxygenase-like lactoylglutathione lyase family enzyme